MAEELYEEFRTTDIPVCSGLPLYRQLEKCNKLNFGASDKNLSKSPAYLAASIELTMAIATLKEAAKCLEKPTEYAKISWKLEETLQHTTSEIERRAFYLPTRMRSKPP